MARELFGTHWIKLEVVGDEHTLQPDPFELVAAAPQLVRDGFEVFPYCTDDLVSCQRLLDAGCRMLMPWGAPIGSGQGLLNPCALRTLRARLPDVPLIVDAGIGAPVARRAGHGTGLRRGAAELGRGAGGATRCAWRAPSASRIEGRAAGLALGADGAAGHGGGQHAGGRPALRRMKTAEEIEHAFGIAAPTALDAARALGFVEREAAVLVAMFDAHRRRGGTPAGFALDAAHLPVQRAAAGFAPLSQRRLGLYAIVDSADWVQRVLAAGVRTVQLRLKQAEPGVLRREIRRSIDAAGEVGAQCFINDHWREAIELGAYGVHLGQEDLDLAELDAIRRAGLRLGISTHAYWEVCRAWALRPSYIACGPIHATLLKQMPWIAQGEDNLAYWCALLGELPVVGIGGLDAARCREVMRCGADGACVVSAITGAVDPEAAIATLQAAVAEGAALPRRAVPMLPRPTLAR